MGRGWGGAEDVCARNGWMSGLGGLGGCVAGWVGWSVGWLID